MVNGHAHTPTHRRPVAVLFLLQQQLQQQQQPANLPITQTWTRTRNKTLEKGLQGVVTRTVVTMIATTAIWAVAVGGREARKAMAAAAVAEDETSSQQRTRVSSRICRYMLSVKRDLSCVCVREQFSCEPPPPRHALSTLSCTFPQRFIARSGGGGGIFFCPIIFNGRIMGSSILAGVFRFHVCMMCTRLFY